MNNRYLLLILLFCTSCVTVLNQGISYEEMMHMRSDAADSLEFQAEFHSCKINNKHNLGNYYLKNNLWGQSRLEGAPAELCVYSSGDKAGWKWRLPDNAKGVIGYPAVQWGEGPWNVSTKTHGFPVRLDSLKVLNVTYEAEQHVKFKKYNLAFDLWLSNAFLSRPQTITTEIMIWEDYNDFRSNGKKIGVLLAPFGIYEMREGYVKNKEFGQDWKYFAFVRIDKRQSGQIDLNFFLQYLIKNYKIDSKQYLTSVELGNEIGNSSGFTMLSGLNLELIQN